MTDEPDFDWSQAASLLGEDPEQVPDDMAAIARELVEGANLQFEEMKSKNAGTDRKTISSLAHQLRGCLLNFGFTEVGAVLLQLEGGSYPTSDYLRLVDHAQAVFVVSRKMLGTRYPSLGLS